MAVIIKNNKLYIVLAETDSCDENRITVSTSGASTTGQYDTGREEDRDYIRSFLGDLKKKLVTDPVKIRDFNKIVKDRVFKKYRRLFQDGMTAYDKNIKKFCKDPIEVGKGLIWSIDDRYLKVDKLQDWDNFEKILLGEITSLVIDPKDDKFIIYPEFHPMFLCHTDLDDYEDYEENFYIDLKNIDGFKSFKDWLTSVDNPNWKGKETSYAQYESGLTKYLQEALTLGFVSTTDFYKLSYDKVVSLIEIGEVNENLLNFDKDNSTKSGISALKLYKLYYEYLLKKFFKTGADNVIYYGSPGCGKSYKVKELYCEDSKGNKKLYVRTIFHPDYTNSDFVGQIVPTLQRDSTGKEVPTYVFKQGPFTKALIMAYNNPNKPVTLIIDELNRGNAAAIFGELFQLLDRDKKGSSEYGVENLNVIDELNKHVSPYYKRLYYGEFTEVKIPSNLTIVATMNTSDQNLYPLDSAFQRRWRMEKISNSFFKENEKVKYSSTYLDDKSHYINDYAYELSKMLIPGTTDVTWRQFVQTVNKQILHDHKGPYGSEDKQIGIYFATEKELQKDNTKGFSEKILKYIWDDIAKTNLSEWFDKDIETLDDLISKFETSNLDVFNKNTLDFSEFAAVISKVNPAINGTTTITSASTDASETVTIVNPSTEDTTSTTIVDNSNNE